MYSNVVSLLSGKLKNLNENVIKVCDVFEMKIVFLLQENLNMYQKLSQACYLS
jgi:hypothetical protein